MIKPQTTPVPGARSHHSHPPKGIGNVLSWHRHIDIGPGDRRRIRYCAAAPSFLFPNARTTGLHFGFPSTTASSPGSRPEYACTLVTMSLADQENQPEVRSSFYPGALSIRELSDQILGKIRGSWYFRGDRVRNLDRPGIYRQQLCPSVRSSLLRCWKYIPVVR